MLARRREAGRFGVSVVKWRCALIAVVLLLPFARAAEPQAVAPPKLALPVERDGWLVPAPDQKAEPVWGVKGGIVVALWPVSGGPRGLLRIYSPYLGQPRGRLINFIAVEPIVGKRRGLSELERSKLDQTPGKAMWTGKDMENDPKPRPPWQPATGKIFRSAGTEMLTFFLFVEPFDNEARPVVQVTLRQDRPHEVSLKVFAAKRSAPMRACVLTATMGNYARLRNLWLNGGVAQSALVWKEPRLNSWGFTSHKQWGMDRLRSDGGDIVVAATPDEADPAAAKYADSVAAHWRYEGLPGTQYWRAARQKGLVARVNGRVHYWASQAPIPGGISYENFELEAPFRAGQEFRFGVTPRTPEELGFPSAWQKNVTDGAQK
jgi:hypothetical protein